MAFSSHEVSKDNSSIVWLTPKEILELFPVADLDPCAASEPRPWPTARTMWTVADDGLSKDWFGRVWLNPPYGRQIELWMKKMAEHSNGIAITYARTDTGWFHKWVAPYASAVFFFKGRIRFHRASGERAAPATAPHMLISFGNDNAELLAQIKIPGILYLPGQKGIDLGSRK